MPVKINGTTSGSVTLAAPDTGSDVTLTLPASAGTVALTSQLGKILQVVRGSTSTQASSTSSTYADTGLSATITPTSASSKILVIINQNGISKVSAVTNVRVGLKVFRGATEILGEQPVNWLYTTVGEYNRSWAVTLLDEPATTSATTYKTQFNDITNTGTFRVQDGSNLSSIVLMEVRA